MLHLLRLRPADSFRPRLEILHPWLVGIFSILHLYAQNIGFVRDGDVPVALLASAILASICFLALRQLPWTRLAAALATTVVLQSFYVYGHLASLGVEHGREIPDPALLAVVGLLAAALIWLVWSFRKSPVLGAMGTALSIAYALMLILPSIQIANYRIAAASATPDAAGVSSDQPPRVAKRDDGPGVPDVYYIIADGYSSSAHLRRVWNYDNRRFTEALEELGFRIAAQSRSNYGATLLSLGSSLNMRYLGENESEITDDLIYLRSLIADSEVARQFLERGYTYNYMLSGYLAPSRIADRNIDFTPSGVVEFGFQDVSEQRLDSDAITDGRFYKQSFYETLANTTLLRPLSGRLQPFFHAIDEPYKWSDPERFFAALDELERISENPLATFSFVHLLEPHGPVQLARDGSLLPRKLWNPKPREFFAELELVNERLLATLERLIERSATPPVIILQGDHGSDLGSVWTRTNPKKLTHFEILNAYLLPGRNELQLAPDITPVNSFRVLFNAYFGTHYEMLPARHYDIPNGYEDPFQQVDVTATLGG